MKRLFLLVGLCLMASLVLAPAVMAQDSPAFTLAPDDGIPETLENTCEGIVSQEGFEACDAARDQYFGTTPPEAPAVPAQTPAAPAATPTATETYSELPDTGGFSLAALSAGALLIAGGLVLRKR